MVHLAATIITTRYLAPSGCCCGVAGVGQRWPLRSRPTGRPRQTRFRSRARQPGSLSVWEREGGLNLNVQLAGLLLDLAARGGSFGALLPS